MCAVDVPRERARLSQTRRARRVKGQHPELADVKVLSPDQVLRVLTEVPTYASHFCYADTSSLVTAPPLEPGTGYFLCHEYPRWAHSLVLWRGLDGDYVFFDTGGGPAPDEVNDYLCEHGVTVVYQTHRLQQIPGVGSCNYHCFDFMSFLTRTKYVASAQVCDLYLEVRPQFDDVKIIKWVESDILALMVPSISIRCEHRCEGPYYWDGVII